MFEQTTRARLTLSAEEGARRARASRLLKVNEVNVVMLLSCQFCIRIRQILDALRSII